MECYYYFATLNSYNKKYAPFGYGGKAANTSQNLIDTVITLPSKMRTIPSVSLSGSSLIANSGYDSVAQLHLTIRNLDAISNNLALIYMLVDSDDTIVENTVYTIYAFDTTTSLYFDAEIYS